MSTSVSVRSFFQMQVIAAHNRLPKRALFFSHSNKSWEAVLAALAVHSTIRNPDSLHFSSQSSLEVGIFLHGCKIIAPPSGIASIIKREKRRWSAGGKSSLVYGPLYYWCGVTLSEVYSQQLTVLGHSSLKKAWERHFILVAHVDATSKSRVPL